tara:strand:+ start:965 stop:1324 length:360 start_codon:yes stop_codon:yes gene_type:complete
MATLATLEGLNIKPVVSPTPANLVAGHLRVTTAQGPLKVEYNQFQQATADSFSATDTFVTGLQSPLFAEVQVLTRANGLDNNISAEVETLDTVATYRTVSVRDTDAQNGLGILVTVYGF